MSSSKISPSRVAVYATVLVALESFFQPWSYRAIGYDYPTSLTQTLFWSGYYLLARVASSSYLQSHEWTVWVVAGILNVVLFSTISFIAVFATRAFRTRIRQIVILSVLVLYSLLALVLFPATIGP